MIKIFVRNIKNMKNMYVCDVPSRYKVWCDRDGRTNDIVVHIRVGMVDVVPDCALFLSEFMSDKRIKETEVYIRAKNGLRVRRRNQIATNFTVYKTIEVPSGKRIKSLTFSIEERFNRSSNIEERNKLVDFLALLFKFDNVREYKMNSLFRD